MSISFPRDSEKPRSPPEFRLRPPGAPAPQVLEPGCEGRRGTRPFVRTFAKAPGRTGALFCGHHGHGDPPVNVDCAGRRNPRSAPSKWNFVVEINHGSLTDVTKPLRPLACEELIGTLGKSAGACQDACAVPGIMSCGVCMGWAGRFPAGPKSPTASGRRPQGR